MKTLFHIIAIWVAVVLSAILLSMGSKEAKEDKWNMSSTVQGISGRVEIWEGNFMPMVDPNSTKNKITPATGRKVRVHEPYHVTSGMSSAKVDSIGSALVAETMTDDSGRFVFRLDPGTYSVFVEENGSWYNNAWNGDGIQGAVTVEPEKMTETLIKITSKATF